MRLHVVVRGRVQGVGFRWFVQTTAERLGLAGWVRNTEDGAVEVEAEGDAAAVERLREAIATGPRGARVENTETLPASNADLQHPFTISR